MNSKPFSFIDDLKWNKFISKNTLITGMGVLAVGYEFTAISLTLLIVLSSLHITGKEKPLFEGLLVSSGYLGMVTGGIIFGLLSNKGRKKYYGVDVLLMGIGSALQFLVSDTLELVLLRALIGVGVGADFVLSPVIIAENSNSADRGKAIAIGRVVMITLGDIVASLVFLGLLLSHVSPSLLWRVTLSLGAVPALGTFYLRRKLPDTVRYLGRVKGDLKALNEAARQITGKEIKIRDITVDNTPAAVYFKRNWKLFLTSALLWSLLDLNIGIKEFGPTLIAHRIGITDPAVYKIVTDLGFALPGAFLGLWLIDKGRKLSQAVSLVSLVFILSLFVALRDVLSDVGLFLLISTYYFAYNIGTHPIIGTGLPAVELAPTKVRGLVQGIVVAVAKAGGAVGTLVFPLLVHQYGLIGAFIPSITIYIVMLLLYLLVIPETGKKPLEEVSMEVVEGQKAEDK